ncbi:MAG: amidohydrolase [Longimicrobiales bacterium]
MYRAEQTPVIITAQTIHSLADAVAGNALLVADGWVRAVGDVAQLRTLEPTARLTDFGTATLTPGLTDSHIHITEWAVARQEVDLSTARSPQEATQRVAQLGRPRASGWLLGRGWNPHHWGGDYPQRDTLDVVVPDRPAAFQSHDMHALWVNTRALELSGIGADTPDPAGGRIVRDAKGVPTGTLLENAALMVIRHIPTPGDAEVSAAVFDAQRQLHSFGITGIHSLPGFHLIAPQPLRILEILREQDRLRLRVLQHMALDQLDAARQLGLRSGLGDEWLRLGGIKMFLDGALGSRTAWLRAPYENSTDCGVQVLPESDFRTAVQCAAAAGLASTVHAIGDAAVALAFEVLTADAAQSGTLPNRIEHVQCCPPDHFESAARAGIICSMQPCHLMTDWPAADRHWGPQRARNTYAFRSLGQRGATLALGSDAPVEPCDPRLGFYAATERKDLAHLPTGGWFPQERIAMSDVLRGYTVGPARAAGASSWQGRLAPGYAADFVAWECDPLSTVGTDLLSLRVLATFVAGALVYQDG